MGNVEEDMPGVVLAMNSLHEDRRSGVDDVEGESNREAVKRGSMKLVEMAEGDNTIENFPLFAHILENLKVLDFADCEELSGTLVELVW